MKRVLSFAPLLALAGCVIPVGGAEVGDLRVTWSFDGSQRCAGVGVDNVTIQLIEKGKEGKDGAKAFGQTAECIAGSMVIPDIVAGSYVMTAVGTGEVAVFDNGDGVTIEVVPNQLTEASAPLALANGEVVSRIEFQYTFAGEALCSAADVTNVNAQVIDENGIAIAGSNTDCINGLAAVEGIRVGEHTLRVEGADGDGNVRYVAEKPLVGLQPGETLRLDAIDLTAALVDFEVAFTFDPATCAAAGIDNVDVVLKQGSEVIAAQNVPCIDGRALFTDMPIGDYTVAIDAVDGNDDVLFDGTQDFTLDGTDDNIAVELDAKQATVTIPFNFPGGESCAELGIANVDIQITDDDGNTTGVNVACIAGDSGPLVVVPGDATIRISAIAGDDVTFEFSGTRSIDPGEQILDSIALVSVRSTLVASWDFNLVTDTIGDVGAPIERVTTSCIAADVDTVIVRVFRGNILEVAQAVDCDEGRLEMPGIDVGNVRVEVEGIREQDGDAPFFLNTPVVAVAGPRTEKAFRLEPALVFVLVVWAGDCGVANAATVDVQIDANGINTGLNMPCAQGSQKIALPPGSQNGNVTINLRGVDGQGVPDAVDTETIGPVRPVPGVITFRFAGPI